MAWSISHLETGWVRELCPTWALRLVCVVLNMRFIIILLIEPQKYAHQTDRGQKSEQCVF